VGGVTKRTAITLASAATVALFATRAWWVNCAEWQALHFGYFTAAERRALKVARAKDISEQTLAEMDLIIRYYQALHERLVATRIWFGGEPERERRERRKAARAAVTP
jgi:hypothetical protein